MRKPILPKPLWILFQRRRRKTTLTFISASHLAPILSLRILSLTHLSILRELGQIRLRHRGSLRHNWSLVRSIIHPRIQVRRSREIILSWRFLTIAHRITHLRVLHHHIGVHTSHLLLAHLGDLVLIILVKGLTHLLWVASLHIGRHCPGVGVQLLWHHVVIVVVVVVVVIDLNMVRPRLRRRDLSSWRLLRNVTSLTTALLSFINSNNSDLKQCTLPYIVYMGIKFTDFWYWIQAIFMFAKRFQIIFWLWVYIYYICIGCQVKYLNSTCRGSFLKFGPNCRWRSWSWDSCRSGSYSWTYTGSWSQTAAQRRKPRQSSCSRSDSKSRPLAPPSGTILSLNTHRIFNNIFYSTIYSLLKFQTSNPPKLSLTKS